MNNDSTAKTANENDKVVYGMKYKNRKIIVQSLAGMASSLTIQILHPFDLLKTRFQSHDSGPRNTNLVPKYTSILDSIRSVVKTEGYGALFKGVSIAMIGNNLSYGLFFALYEKHRQVFKQYIPDSEFGLSLASSALAAFYGSLIMQPVWVLKTRRLLDSEKGKDWSRSKILLKEIKTHHGFLGFYRGFSLSLALGLYGTIQLTMYSTVSDLVRKSRESELRSKLGDRVDSQENWDAERSKNQTSLNNMEIAFLGAASRLLASVVLYPLTTVRTRYQQNQFFQGLEGEKYINIRDIVKKTFQLEGWRGFYKGIVAMTLRTLPSQGLFFIVYENVKKSSSKFLDVSYQNSDYK